MSLVRTSTDRRHRLTQESDVRQHRRQLRPERIENRAPNVGRQFFDRVEAAPHREAYRYPVGEQLGVA